MKKEYTLFIFIILFSIYTFECFGQVGDTWTQKSDFGFNLPNGPMGRQGAAAFSLGSKGYSGTGMNAGGNMQNDFWEYDPATNTWTQKANFGGAGRMYAVGFSIGLKGYIGLGNSALGSYMNDFWEYDPLNNAWLQKSNFGGAGRMMATGFSIGSKGYIGTGQSAVNQYEKDFWEYDPSTNTWLQKADYGGPGKNGATGFSIGNKGYLGTGYISGGIPTKDIWEYNPSGNTWTQKSDFAGSSRYFAISFSIGSKGYIGTGAGNGYLNDFWEYNPSNDTWIQKANLQGNGRSLAIGICIGTKGYIGTGCDMNNNLFTDFSEFDPSNNTWTPKASLGGTPREFAVGFSIGNKGYLGTGDAGINTYFNDFWAYDPLTNSWTQKANVGGNPRTRAVGFSIGNKGYIGTGWNIGATFVNDFWEYDPSSNSWTQKANFSGSPRMLAVGFNIGSKGYIGTGSEAGGYTNDFWEYNPTVNSWTQKTNFGGGPRGYAAGFNIGDKGYIGTGIDAGGITKNDFWEFNPVTNIWLQKSDLPTSPREGATGFSIGTKGYLGTGIGMSLYSDFWEYNPLLNLWTQRYSLSDSGRGWAVGFNIGTKGYLGTGWDGSNYKMDFWEYFPPCTLPSAPTNTTPLANRSICSGQSTTITASGTGTLGWYSAATGGTYLGGGSNFTTQILSTTTTFYVQDSTCFASPARTAILVTVNQLPVANAGSNRAICLNSSTQLGAAAVVGNTYSWTSSPIGYTSTSANPTIYPLVTTTYILTETVTATGCSKTNNVTITVNPLPAANVGTNQTICLNTITSIGAAAVAGNTYSWTSSPSGFTSSSANPTVSPLVTTTYTLIETITATGCFKSNSVTVTVNPLPVANAGANRAICLNQSTTLGAAAVAGNTYSWTSSPAGFTSAIANPTVTPMVTTTYTLTETVTATGCSKSNNVTVTVNPLPAASAGLSRSNCQNVSTQIGASPVTGSTYSWTSSPAGFTSTTANPTVSPNVTTTYNMIETVTATGCTNTNNVTVTVTPGPAAVAGTDRIICLNSSTQIGAAPVAGSNYSWTSVPAGFISAIANPTVTPLVNTTYYLTETSTVTGCSNTNSIIVSVSAPAAIAGPDRTLCMGATTQLGATAVAGSTYAWTSSPSGFTSNLANPTVSPLIPTTYTLTETVTASGCTNTHNVIVNLNPSPAANAGFDQTICQNSTASIGSLPVTGNTYNWTSSPPGFTSTSANPTVSPPVTTIFTLTETIIATGCSKSNSVTITVNPSPAAITGANQTICLYSSAVIGANAVSGNTYNWTSSPAGFTSTLANPTVTPLVTTTYYLTETITATSCTKSNTVTVTVNPLPAAATGTNKTICENASTQIGAASVAGSSYSWTSSPAGFSSTLANPIVNPLAMTTYYLTEIITATGCAQSNNMTVTVNPIPAAVAGTNATICEGTVTSIGAPPVVGNTYNWISLPAGFNSTLSNPSVSPSVTTTYILTETVTSTGCFKNNSVIISVNPAPAAATGPNKEVCLGLGCTIGSLPVPGNTYSWTSIPAGFTSNIANPTVNPFVTTTYYLTETITATDCSATDSVVVTVNPLPAAAAGPNRAICLNASTQLGAVPVVGHSYSWTSVPTGFTSALANPIVTPLVSTVYTLTENVLASGCANTNSVVVSVNPLPFPSISGSSSVCARTSGVTYTTQTGMGNYQWNISPGGTILSGPGTSSITVRWDSAGAQFVSTNYTNSFGCFAQNPAVKNVTVNPRPVPTISGTDSLCMNTSGTYTTESGMFQYQWMISPGGSTVTGMGTNSIQVTWTTSGPRTVSVHYLNSNNCASDTNIFNVLVFPLPAPTITGNTMVCANSINNGYSTESGMNNYVWTVSSNGTITSGQNSDSIAVDFGNVGTATISVTYTSDLGCNPGSSGIITSTINPRPIPTISGSNSACVNSGPKTYSTQGGQLNYIWNISAGDSILSGAGTSSVSVKWKIAGSRWLSATYSSSIGCPAAIPDTMLVTVTPLPSAASSVSGPTLLCFPVFWQQYSIAPVANANSYFWTLPSGGIFQGPSNTNTIHAAYLDNSVSGDVIVYGINACGNGPSSNLFVTLDQIPLKPVISLGQNDTLFSDAPFGNQWYFNDQLLPGDTLNHLYASLTGDYHTIVTLNNCVSEPSEKLYVIAVGIEGAKDFRIHIHPNPTQGKLYIDFISPQDIMFKLALYNELGTKMLQSEKIVPKGNSTWVIDLGSFSPGLFLLTFQSAEGVFRKKIIKN